MSFQQEKVFHCIHPEDTQHLAMRLARICYEKTAIQTDKEGLLIALEGDLGAGKTCFSQGFIGALLPDAIVKSPTYTLIESYPLDKISLYHLDLYRIHDPEELEYLGIREFLWHNICLVEWASNAKDWLPVPDILIKLQSFEAYRQVSVTSFSMMGSRVVSVLSCV